MTNRVWPYTHLEDGFTYPSYPEKDGLVCSSIYLHGNNLAPAQLAGPTLDA